MSQEPNSAKGICRIFAGGKTCRFGETCRFLHPQNQQNESVREYFDDSSGRTNGARGLCRSYLKTKLCKFGAKCRYQHTLPEHLSAPSDIKANRDGSLNQQEHALLLGDGEKPYFAFPLPNDGKQDLKNDAKEKSSQSSKHGTDTPEVSNVDVRGNGQYRGRSGNNVRGGGPRGRSYDRARRYQPRHDRGGLTNPANLADAEGPSADGFPFSSQEDVLPKLPDDSGAGNDPKNSNDTEKAALRAHGKTSANKPRRRLCRYFKAGHCTMGNRCRFWHPAAASFRLDEDGASHSKQDKFSTTRARQPVRKPTEYSLAALTEDDARNVRKTEIDQMLRRFPKASFIIDEPDSWSCQFTFTTTDPDWVFDVKDLILTIEFPAKYPLEPMTITVLEEQEMPEAVIRYAKIAISDWIKDRFKTFNDKSKAELMFRPFIRWLDRTLEEIFTEGLRRYKLELQAAAAGVQFISGSELREKYIQKQSDESNSDQTGDESDSEEHSDDYYDSEEEELAPQPSHVGEMPPESAEAIEQTSPETARKGTEVKIVKLQLAENAATLILTKVRLIIQCSRCKNKAELLTPCGRVNQLECTKCSQSMLVNFRASMAHQFSSVVGYIDLANAIPFDLVLVDCHFEVGCFNCNRNMRVEGISVGQPYENFCHHCHKKMKVCNESVRFLELQTTVNLEASDALVLENKKTKKLPKDPAIQLGKPLPYEGACKHYKKSFRWLRFPCCGKAYPCDVCHDENEGDHELTWANRMICGFCCKEQMFAADKPCSGCGSHLTKKSGSHWEGGKGCRDKIKMSRDDAKKYASMTKTLSKKSQAKKETKGSKTTKLRHA